MFLKQKMNYNEIYAFMIRELGAVVNWTCSSQYLERVTTFTAYKDYIILIHIVHTLRSTKLWSMKTTFNLSCFSCCYKEHNFVKWNGSVYTELFLSFPIIAKTTKLIFAWFTPKRDIISHLMMLYVLQRNILGRKWQFLKLKSAKLGWREYNHEISDHWII